MSDKTTTVVNEFGELVEANPAQLKALQRHGQARVADTADILEASVEAGQKKRATTLKGKAVAAGAGLARGLSFGLSDLYLTELAGVDPDTLGRAQKYNPTLSSAAELVGLVGSAVASGGSSGLAKLVQATPAGALARGTRLLGDAAAKRLGGGTLAATAGFMVEGAVEGGIWNTGQALSQAAITNVPLTAEDVAGAFVRGGLTGLLGGAVAGGGLAIGRKVASRAKNLIDVGSDSGKLVSTSADNVFVGLNKLDESLIPKPPTLVGGSVAKNPRLTRLETEVAELRATIKDTSNLSAQKAGLQAKLSDLEKELFILRRGADTVGSPTNRVVSEELSQAFKVDPAKLRAAQKKLTKELGGELSGQSFIKAINKADFETELPKLMKSYGDVVAEAKKIPGGEFIVELDLGLQKSVQEAVASQFGQKTAKTFIDKAADVASAFEVADLVTDAAGVDINPLPPGAEAMMALLVLNRYRGKLGATKGNKLSSFIAGAAGSRVGGSVARQTADAIGAPGLVGDAARGAGNAIGFSEGKALVQGTQRTVRGIDSDIFALAQRQIQSERRIVAAMEKFAAGSRKASPLRLKAAHILGDFIQQGNKPPPKKWQSEEIRDFLAAQDALKKVMGDPMGTMAKLSENTAILELLHPDLAVGVRENALATMQYLHSKLPQNPGTQATVFGDDWAPNPAEMRTWLRYARAALDPASVYEDLASGRLTKEAAETARELHGAHMQDVLRYFASNSEKFSRMSIQSKTQLALLLDAPTHPSLLQFNALQSTWAALEEQQAEQPAQSEVAPKPNTTPTKAQELTAR